LATIFFCAHLAAKHRRQNGRANIVANADNDAVEISDAKLGNGAFVRRIRLYRTHYVFLDGAHAVRAFINGEHLVTQHRQHARGTLSKAPQPDNEKTFTHGDLSLILSDPYLAARGFVFASADQHVLRG
jgi:hypothetical protein